MMCSGIAALPWGDWVRLHEKQAICPRADRRARHCDYADMPAELPTKAPHEAICDRIDARPRVRGAQRRAQPGAKPRCDDAGRARHVAITRMTGGSLRNTDGLSVSTPRGEPVERPISSH